MLKAIAHVGTLQIIGAVVFVVRVKTTAVLLGPAGVGVVSVVDQFVQLVLQLAAVSLPFAAVKFLIWLAVALFILWIIGWVIGSGASAGGRRWYYW